MLDERLGLRPWKEVNHRVCTRDGSAFDLRLLARTRPPPLGANDWPAGRVLLQWCLDHLPTRDCSILEIGAGIGTTAIGLACANKCGTATRSVLATDYDNEVLDILKGNASMNSLIDEPSALSIAVWDAAKGERALADLPTDLSTLTHVIGSDLIYWGGADDGLHRKGEGLVNTLAALLQAAPHLEVVMLCVARGPVVVPCNADTLTSQTSLSSEAPAQISSVPQSGNYLSLTHFEQKCASVGLRAERTPLPEDTARRVSAMQWPLIRVVWWLAGFWDSFVLYRVSLPQHVARGGTDYSNHPC